MTSTPRTGTRVVAIGLLSGAIVAAGMMLAPLAGNATTSYAQQVVALTNQQRTAHGCGALTMDSALTNAAQAHSAEMARYNYLSHTGRDSSSPATRISSTGYHYQSWGENIAAGYATPSAVVKAWMASPDHRANILNCKFHDIGVGYATNSSSTYHTYWTQDFGSR